MQESEPNEKVVRCFTQMMLSSCYFSLETCSEFLITHEGETQKVHKDPSF